MSADKKRSRLAFQKLNRQLTKLAEHPVPANVHKFRTYGRRVEALLDALVPHPNRNDRKLLKLLKSLRKRAGRVRDLDVQVSALRNLKVPQDPGGKADLIRELTAERATQEKRLARAFNKSTLRELRRRLKRAQGDEFPSNTNPLDMALRQLGALSRERAPLTEKTLHNYRIVGKRARYLAELGEDGMEAKRVIQLLKRMQDVLGDWHDWLKLTEKAESYYGTAYDGNLPSVLQSITREKFRNAVAMLAETRAALSERKPAAIVRRAPASASDSAAA